MKATKSEKPAKAVKSEKTSKKAKSGSAPTVHTASRTDKSKMPSILMSKAYLDLVAHIDSEEKKLNISRTDLFVGGHVENAISTGILSLDFTMGGGYSGGRFYQSPGREEAVRPVLSSQQSQILQHRTYLPPSLMQSRHSMLVMQIVL